MLIILFASCNNGGADTAALQTRIDSLQKQLAGSYRPGLGEFMAGIQLHHEKLWFAGQAQNWKLADFEIHEIMEALDDIKVYASDRPEVKSLPMIMAPVDSMNNAIAKKDPVLFKSAYMLLTNTCNNCHRATQHEFNVIKTPTVPPVSDQEFELK